jgi:hypothetical protein
MNLRAKRLVRTTCSEQYALFDLDRTDQNYDPISVGKFDLHYTGQGIYGTLLFWQEACEPYSWPDITRLAESLLSEFNSPMGVPAEYAIEFFAPSLGRYELLTNIRPEQAEDEAGVPAAEEPSGSGEAIDTGGNQEDGDSGPLVRGDLHRRVEWRDEDANA